MSCPALPSLSPSFHTCVVCPHLARDSDFIKEYQLDCPYAMDRLVKYGVPATVLHRQVDERDQIGRARQAAETVSLPKLAGSSSRRPFFSCSTRRMPVFLVHAT